LRAPSLLHDYHTLENALGSHLPPSGDVLPGFTADPTRTRIYRFALERGKLDAYLDTYVVRPFVALFRWCDALERRWTDFLSGSASRESDRLAPSAGSLEEIA
jgi:NAD(P)H-quinone oxidoreductase subunit 5